MMGNTGRIVQFQKKNPRGRGILKGKILEAKYEAKLEFPGEGGVQNKNASVKGEYGYFLKLHIVFSNVCISNKTTLFYCHTRRPGGGLTCKCDRGDCRTFYRLKFVVWYPLRC